MSLSKKTSAQYKTIKNRIASNSVEDTLGPSMQKNWDRLPKGEMGDLTMHFGKGGKRLGQKYVKVGIGSGGWYTRPDKKGKIAPLGESWSTGSYYKP